MKISRISKLRKKVLRARKRRLFMYLFWMIIFPYVSFITLGICLNEPFSFIFNSFAAIEVLIAIIYTVQKT